MANEVRLMGELCNLGCLYCYQEPIRLANNISSKYDLDKVIAEIEKVGKEFHLFGGEALLVPKKDLEYLWRYGLERFGKNGLQTNGTLIDDEHIELFKKYKVSVGVSIDGDGELNSLREVRAGKSGTPEKKERTLEATETIMRNIKKMVDNGISVGIIITLHRKNGSRENLPKLIQFIEKLSDIGIKGGNIHTLEVEETMPNKEDVLTPEENVEAFLTLAKFFSENKHLRYKPFHEIPDLLKGDDRNATCYWKNCDPLNTKAVYGIEGNGDISNCGRVNKEGVGWYKANGTSYSRYISFYHTPDEYGGCNGCRFWSICGGSCPGESEKGDFRNKTIHCRTQKALLGYYEDKLEEEGIVPFTKSPMIKKIENRLLGWMQEGKSPSVYHAIKVEDEIENKRSEEIEKQRNSFLEGKRTVIVPVKGDEVVNETA